MDSKRYFGGNVNGRLSEGSDHEKEAPEQHWNFRKGKPWPLTSGKERYAPATLDSAEHGWGWNCVWDAI